MSCQKEVERMGKGLLQALDAYEKAFDDSFPTLPMSGRPEGEMIQIINECISEKKDVYALDYLDINAIY